MAQRYPIKYRLNPTHLEPGWRWVSLNLRNAGSEDLTGLDVRLNSLDDYSLRTVGTGSYIPLLKPDEQRVEAFQVAANRTGQLYISVEGMQGVTYFHWESPTILVTVGREPAHLVRLFAVSEPYPPVGRRIRIEATVRGTGDSEALRLELWAETPDDRFEALAEIETKALSAGEESTYAAEFVPEEEGAYTIYAYLYDDMRRIGRKTEELHARGT
jgi:hypothetical protein